MNSIYLETSIPSYLAGDPSRDLLVNARQQLSHTWWQRIRSSYPLFISEIVLEEIRKGDARMVEKRLALVQDLEILALSSTVADLVHLYQKKLGLSPEAQSDITHIALSVVYEVDYLVTWNCSHIANPVVIRRLLTINQQLKRFTPLILTPEEFFEIEGHYCPVISQTIAIG